MNASSVPLAADVTPSLLLIMIGIVVAVLLLGAFWLGSRRAARRKDPGVRPSPMDQNPQAAARQDSWQTPDERPDR
ncbi:hypothetical protein EES43_27760 [Streptomyces sp. ADI96-02]|uniref:DUF6479 family protein n=1 Tax=Streptomyces sp. ADI96-02 TaxID=1522760 RepID=UPI000F557D10|nr:DUF6479 family protein [Streptomyces sp. ADI96-02]RPK54866.1 hypothetical protein EES43_27760 [Streptomyces sp. ADI96-02]